MPDPNNENTEITTVPFSDISNKIAKNVSKIEAASRGARARMPIHNAIEDIAQESDNKIRVLNKRIDDEQITELLDSASVIAQASQSIDALNKRYRQSDIEKESIEASVAANVADISVNYDTSLTAPQIGFVDANAKWQLRTPPWPMFGRFNIDRGRDQSLRTVELGNVDSIPKDTASLDYVNILGQIPNVNVRMVDRFWHTNVMAKLATYAEQNQSLDKLVKWDLENTTGSRPQLTFYLPPGDEGTGEGSNENRPFISSTKIVESGGLPGLSAEFGDSNGGAWIARGYDHNGAVGTEGNPAPPAPSNWVTRSHRDLDGVLITFQKTRIFENSAEASGSGVSYGNLYVPGTNILVARNNTHWNQRVTVFLPHGGRVTASIVDGDGHRFSREVMWGSYPHVLCARQEYSHTITEHIVSSIYDYYSVRDQYTTVYDPSVTCGGLIFSGGRANGFGTYYINQLIRFYGIKKQDGSFIHNQRWVVDGARAYQWWKAYVSEFGYSYIPGNTEVDEGGNRYFAFENAIMANELFRNGWPMHFGAEEKYQRADRWVARNVMIPINITGVWFGMSQEAENQLRG